MCIRDRHKRSSVNLVKFFDELRTVNQSSINLRTKLTELVGKSSGDTSYVKERSNEIRAALRKVVEHLSRAVFQSYQFVDSTPCRNAIQKLGPIKFDGYHPADFLVFVYETAQACECYVCENQTSLIEVPSRLSLIERLLRKLR
eukprot:TRINITY_DN4985_c0_g2_i2.p1 TRINITY_DN4985_c0_g2~~TRINITY_DN4985_c0_g2_i2.p1  ORF type:complete len:144 (+),score=25.58 TRINITY_DN4985_c0_g2_i2:66-497(+)